MHALTEASAQLCDKVVGDGFLRIVYAFDGGGLAIELQRHKSVIDTLTALWVDELDEQLVDIAVFTADGLLRDHVAVVVFKGSVFSLERSEEHTSELQSRGHLV